MDHRPLCLWFLPMLLMVYAASEEDKLVVRIEQGLVKGLKVTSIRDQELYGFFGIPFAKPPIGELRFKEPQPLDPWEDIFLAHQEGNMCPQLNFMEGKDDMMGDEDCLYVNVYTNKLPDDDNNELAAVMVFLHGGAFVGGSGSSMLYGPDHLLTEGIVFVSLNYRLGFLGFMCLNEDCLPCNNGLRDQAMALQWVQKNIAEFGGDPKRITIFGESAGGASVHFHMLSSLSKGLYHRAISQSGTSIAYWAYEEPDVLRSKTFELGKILGCDTTHSKGLLQCLRAKSASDILLTTKKQEIMDLDIALYKPTRENETCGNVFLSDRPDKLMSAGKFNVVPFIIGVNNKEALAFLQQTKIEGFWERFEDNCEKVISSITRKDKPKAKTLIQKIKKYYFREAEPSKEMAVFIELFTDVSFIVMADRVARKQASLGADPVYYYYFQYEGALNIVKQAMGIETPGAAHADELGYLFQTMISELVDDDSDEMKMVTRMVKMWTNFAKTGNPSSDMNAVLNVKWEPMTKDNPAYLDINKDLSIRSHLLKERMEFWDQILGPI